MNYCLSSVFHQMKIAVDSMIVIINQISNIDLESRPIRNKRSYLELLTHISLLCRADLLISNESSNDEMKALYEKNVFKTIEEIKEHLITNYNQLVEEYSNYTEEKLFEYTKSYWGVKYTRYEWLLQMLGHLYHHRGQLHTYISIDYKGIEVQLFE